MKSVLLFAFAGLSLSVSAAAVHPGDPEKGVPFWNASSASFMYPPAFDFRELPRKEDAGREDWQTVKYRFTLSCADGKTRTFEADRPWASLTPVWDEVPVGPVTLTCEGINARGFATGHTRHRL